jgi:uncharacterized protein (TIGR00251 family)
MTPSPPVSVPPFVVANDHGTLLHLHVVPGAARTELAGTHGERLKVRVHARASEGSANRELLRYLGELLGVAPSAIDLVRGASDRRKTVRIPPGADLAALLALARS